MLAAEGAGSTAVPMTPMGFAPGGLPPPATAHMSSSPGGPTVVPAAQNYGPPRASLAPSPMAPMGYGPPGPAGQEPPPEISTAAHPERNGPAPSLSDPAAAATGQGEDAVVAR